MIVESYDQRGKSLMFTGIVKARGRSNAFSQSDGILVTIAAGDLDIGDIALGDSIAVNGCCLTVVAKLGRSLQFDVSGETLRCTSPLDVGAPVNLEKSLRLADRLDGHLVAGTSTASARSLKCGPSPSIRAGAGVS
jgi:riboflavin synthase